jgi:hypothetical protein
MRSFAPPLGGKAGGEKKGVPRGGKKTGGTAWCCEDTSPSSLEGSPNAAAWLLGSVKSSTSSLVVTVCTSAMGAQTQVSLFTSKVGPKLRSQM